jgi:hypothetical protein
MAHTSSDSDDGFGFDSDSDPDNQPIEPNKPLPQALHDILEEFGPIESVVFTPFQTEQPRSARPLFPSSFPVQPQPFDFFTLVFTPDLFHTITTNTNRYANIQRMQVGPVDTGMRDWSDLLVEELYVFIGGVIYMGVHKEPQTPMYWNSDFNKGPVHPLPAHISLRRFEQIKRYCHISCAESDQKAGYHLPKNKMWWYKLEPLASALQASFQQYYSPSSEVSIDELMVRCFGR